MSPSIEAADALNYVRIFFDRIPFNRLLGIEVTQIDFDRVTLTLPMQENLIGNYIYGNLHGGVISTVLDVAGGAMALVGAFQRMKDAGEEERQAVLSKIGTIDLRVDYLRPGRSSGFTATASLLRTGNKVAVTRMELHDRKNNLIAVGTGTYLCG